MVVVGRNVITEMMEVTGVQDAMLVFGNLTVLLYYGTPNATRMVFYSDSTGN